MTPDLRSRVISTRIFIGNLNYSTTSRELTELLETVGEVVDLYLPTDRATGRPRGFAFAEMASAAEAEAAVDQLDGKELGGRAVRINAAEERRGRGPNPGGPGPGGPRPGGPRPGGSRDRGGPRSFDEDPGGFADFDGPPKGGKNKGSRRGLRGKKRSL
jgi:RNA recognition motif-containing protein